MMAEPAKRTGSQGGAPGGEWRGRGPAGISATELGRPGQGREAAFLLVIPYPHSLASLGEGEGLPCLHWGWETSEEAFPLQHDQCPPPPLLLHLRVF